MVTSPYFDQMPAGFRRQGKLIATLPFRHRYDAGILRYTSGSEGQVIGDLGI